MYTEFSSGSNNTANAADINDDWWRPMDEWIDTPAGRRWIDEMADAESMRSAAYSYGTRPGLGGF